MSNLKRIGWRSRPEQGWTGYAHRPGVKVSGGRRMTKRIGMMTPGTPRGREFAALLACGRVAQVAKGNSWDSRLWFQRADEQAGDREAMAVAVLERCGLRVAEQRT